MKKTARSYITFTRTERMGLIGLCVLILALIAVRATMHLWVHPSIDTEKQERLSAAWETFKRNQPGPAPMVNDTASAGNDYQDDADDNATPLPSTIDINTADSATLVRLKGIGPVTAGKIVARRKIKGPFTNVDQLTEIRHFPPDVFAMLRKHLVVGNTKE